MALPSDGGGGGWLFKLIGIWITGVGLRCKATSALPRYRLESVLDLVGCLALSGCRDVVFA